MSKARNEAIRELGREDDYINLKGFNTERTNLQNTYNTDYNNLQNAYNNLIATAEQNKISAGKDFVSNRNVVDTSDYMATRGKTGADLSSRGLSKGFGSAGRFATNLQRNQANSNIANTYYNAMADIQKDIDIGTQTHNYNMESLKNQLAKGMADVAAREAAARNNYRALVSQLAEQKQARYDAQDASDKQYQLSLKQAYMDLGDRFSVDGETDVNKIMSKARELMNKAGYDNIGEALTILKNYGGLDVNAVQAATKRNTNLALAKAYNNDDTKRLINGIQYIWYVDDDGNLAKKQLIHD